MSDLSLEQLYKELNIGGDENSAPKFELKDPVTGEVRQYASQEEQQAAVDTLWRTSQAEKNALLTQLSQLSQAGNSKISAPTGAENNPYNLSEADLKKLNQLSESSPIEAMDFMFEKSPRYKKLADEIQSLKQNTVQAQGAVTATQFMQAHRQDLIDGPNARVIQEAVSALVGSLVPQGQVPPPILLEMALNNVKVMKPELFKQNEQTQQAQGWQESSRPNPLPSPGRDSGSHVQSLGFAQMVDKIYSEKGPEAAKAFLERARNAGAQY